MDETVDVVKVASNTLLEHALDAIRQYDVRAVLVDYTKGKLRLHMNIALLRAIADGLERCGQLTGGRPVVVLDTVNEESLRTAVASYGLARKTLSSGGHQVSEFGLTTEPRKLTLIARDKHLAQQIRGAVKACRCSHDRAHIVDCPPDWQNKPCPSEDGGTMDCY